MRLHVHQSALQLPLLAQLNFILSHIYLIFFIYIVNCIKFFYVSNRVYLRWLN